MKEYLIALLMFCSVCSFSQIKKTEQKKHKIKPYFIFDNSSTFINKKTADIYGVKCSFSIDKKNKIGFGGSFVSEVVVPANEINRNSNLQFGYGTLFYERILIKNFRWEISTPIQFGFGQSRIRELDQFNGNLLVKITHPIQVITVNTRFEYKIRPWVGLDAGFGYRLVLTGDSKTKGVLNAPFLLYGLVFPLDYWYNFFINKSRKEKIVTDFFIALNERKTKRKLKKNH